MNKYIRTKDGIFENKPLEKSLGIRKIAEADTIEELCDGYIVELPMRHYHFYFEKTRNCFAFRNAVEEYNSWKKCNSDFNIEGAKELVYLYGVIWVKGAKGQPIPKVVAKMNEEGKLCLL